MKLNSNNVRETFKKECTNICERNSRWNLIELQIFEGFGRTEKEWMILNEKKEEKIKETTCRNNE